MLIIYHIENITWLRRNMKFIWSVEQDISQVSAVNNCYTLFNMINKFHISKQSCNIFCLFLYVLQHFL